MLCKLPRLELRNYLGLLCLEPSHSFGNGTSPWDAGYLATLLSAQHGQPL